MFYDNDLYEKVIKKNAIHSKQLNVISGFASAIFLKKIISEFPKLKINLYIGMSQLGISEKQHKLFKEIAQKNKQIKIFYQVIGQPTHIKLLEFKKNDNTSIFYNGSANFTQNGYIKWHESMSITEEVPNNIFEEQEVHSRPCDNENILDYISLIDDNFISLELLDKNFETIETQQENIVQEQNNMYNLNSLSLNHNVYSEFKDTIGECNIPIVFENEKAELASVNALNPYLKQSNNSPFLNYFTLNAKIKFITDDNNKFYGYIDSKNRLRFDINIHNYFCYRLKVDNNTNISYEDLLSYGRTHLVIKKNDENGTYYFDFSKNK